MKNYSHSAMKWLLRLLGQSKRQVIVLVIMYSVNALVATLYPIAMLNILNAVEKRNMSEFRLALFLLILISMFQLLSWYLVTWYTEKAHFKVQKNLTEYVLKSWLSRVDLSYFDLQSGEYVNRITSDVATITQGSLTIIPSLCSTLIRLLVTMFILYSLLPSLFFGILMGALVMFVSMVVVRDRIKRLHKDVGEARGNFYSYLQEVFYNPIVIRAFGLEATILEHSETLFTHFRQKRLRQHRFSMTKQLLVSATFSLAIIVGTTLASIDIMKGTLAIGTYMAVAQLIAQIRGPLMSLSGYVSQWFTILASVERLCEINPLYQPVDLVDEKVIWSLPFPDKLSLSDLSFHYGEEKDVLSRLTVHILRGEHLGIVGPSGSGKSTFLKLLIGVYPLQEGKIEVTMGEQKVQLEPSLLAAYRTLFAYVPQGNSLLSGTIRQCVTIGNPSLLENDAEIYRYLHLACADEFVQRLPKGLDSRLEEAGLGLSVGQLQRLAIARALCSQRPYLILDEATSALDQKTETRLIENLRTVRDMTMILVTHRPAPLSLCATILELDPIEIEEN